MPIPLNFPPSKDTMSTTFRTVLYATKKAFDNVADFRAALYTLAADGQKASVKAALVAAYDYTVTEADELVEAVEAAYSLGQVAIGQGVVAGPNDFFFTAKKYWGFNPRP